MQDIQINRLILQLAKNILVFCGMLLLVLLPCHPAASSENRILLVKSGEAKIYQEISASVKQHLLQNCSTDCPDLDVSVDGINLDSLQQALKQNRYRMIITLGRRAADTIHQNHSPKTGIVLNAVTPLTEQLMHAESGHYSLVIDQSSERQLTVISQLLPQIKRLGVLYTQESSWRIEAIRTTAAKKGLALVPIYIEKSNANAIGAIFQQHVDSIDAVLMLPDKQLYNRRNINQLLLNGYLNKVPFIGYSKALVKTGALAAIVTDSQSIATDISDLSQSILQNNAQTPLIYPSTYTIVVNRKIAETLDIVVNEKVSETARLEIIE